MNIIKDIVRKNIDNIYNAFMTYSGYGNLLFNNRTLYQGDFKDGEPIEGAIYTESYNSFNSRYDEGENFEDKNRNGKWDIGEEFTDLGNGKWDEGEKFRDLNLNSLWDADEKFTDFSGGDLFYSGTFTYVGCIYVIVAKFYKIFNF